MRIRTRLLLAAAFAVGYYFGAKAGRERYEQLRRGMKAMPVGKAAGKAKALGQLGAERVSSLRGSRGDAANESGAEASPVSSIRSAGSVRA